MKTLAALIFPIILLAQSAAEERSPSVDEEGFVIMIDNDSVLFWPQNGGLSADGGPYFITIDIAQTVDQLENTAKATSITQAIPIKLETPYPIGLRLKKGTTEIFRVTISSDACFSGWKRSKLYSINSDGVLALTNPQIEQNKAQKP